MAFICHIKDTIKFYVFPFILIIIIIYQGKLRALFRVSSWNTSGASRNNVNKVLWLRQNTNADALLLQ